MGARRAPVDPRAPAGRDALIRHYFLEHRTADGNSERRADSFARSVRFIRIVSRHVLGSANAHVYVDYAALPRKKRSRAPIESEC